MELVEIEIKIECRSALCVGAMGASNKLSADVVTTRDVAGRLIIPASTLKGKLRCECERLLRAVRSNDPGYVCMPPAAEQMCPHRWGEQVIARQNQPCPVCDLFGSPAHRSKLRFSDSKLINKDIYEPAERCGLFAGDDARVRPGVAISRRRRTADEGKLFFTETSLPNGGFHFRSYIKGMLEDKKYESQIALILAGLRSLVAIGRAKSRGLGWVNIQIERINVNGQLIPEKCFTEKLQTLLEAL